MTESRDQHIAPTAHYTAWVWHRLGMPHADLFATVTGKRLFWLFRLAGEWGAAVHPTLPSMVQYLELRHRAIEHALEEQQPDVVVELGAGLSRRGLTWAADRGVPYVEVDLPQMIEVKRALIRERAPLELRRRAEARLRHEAVDVLGAGFARWLSAELAPYSRPAVIAEGLLGYFDPPERASIARAVAGALSGGQHGLFVCDLRAREGGRMVGGAAKLLKGAIWLATRGRGAREDFADSAAIEAFFRETGFGGSAPVPAELAAPHLARIRTPARVWKAWARPA